MTKFLISSAETYYFTECFLIFICGFSVLGIHEKRLLIIYITLILKGGLCSACVCREDCKVMGRYADRVLASGGRR